MVNYKAGLIAQCFHRNLVHINYDKTFTPVIGFESDRGLLSLADFLNGKLD